MTCTRRVKVALSTALKLDPIKLSLSGCSLKSLMTASNNLQPASFSDYSGIRTSFYTYLLRSKRKVFATRSVSPGAWRKLVTFWWASQRSRFDALEYPRPRDDLRLATRAYRPKWPFVRARCVTAQGVCYTQCQSRLTMLHQSFAPHSPERGGSIIQRSSSGSNQIPVPGAHGNSVALESPTEPP